MATNINGFPTPNDDGSVTYASTDGMGNLRTYTLTAAQYGNWLGGWARFWALVDTASFAPKVRFNQPPVPLSDPSVGGTQIPNSSVTWKNPG